MSLAMSNIILGILFSAAFITLSSIFIYAINQFDVLTFIQYRILESIVDVGLSYLAMVFFWATWGRSEIRKDIEKSVMAKRDFH